MDKLVPLIQTQYKTVPGLRFAATTAALILCAFMCAQAQTQLITDGGFEFGGINWTMSGGAGINPSASNAHSGTNSLYLGGFANENDNAYQTIIIPSAVTNATLTFYYNIYSLDTGSTLHDTFTASIQNTSGTTLATVGTWSNLNRDPAHGNPYYHQVTFNLLPYAGQSIRISFSSINNATLTTDFFIDDVSVTVIFPPPANDTCAGAIGLAAGTIYTLNTATATSGGDPTPGCQGSFGKGVWYTFTPVTSGTVTLSTCGSDFDTVLAVYTGSCASLTSLACNDNNGPACSANQASLSFSGTAGTTYFILAGGVGGASGDLAMLATVSGPGLTIIPTFDSSITSDPQAATIETTINAALALYHSKFSDPTTVTIYFQELGGGVASSSTYYNTFNYSDYRAALVSHAASADDAAALAHLPNSSVNPVSGDPGLDITLPLARTLGFIADPPAGQQDATIYLNTSVMNLSITAADPNKYSLYSSVCHEIDEVLGFDSALDGLNNGDPPPSGPVAPEDLFRYDQNGARSFTTDVNAASYFSLDGVTRWARYNQYYTGDFQDWYSYYGGQTPQVQDAFGTRGTAPVPGVELRVLDVLGFTRVVSPSPALALRRSGTNSVVSWPATFVGFTLQSATNLASQASWTTVTNLPVILNSRYNVTNSSGANFRFYRLLK